MSQLQLEQLIDGDIVLLKKDDISWQQDQLIQLTSGQPIITYNENDQLILYLLINKNLKNINASFMQIGPISLPSEDNQIKFLLFIGSYFLLAGIVALWTWPLWRDLLQLQKATKQFSHGVITTDISISKRSVIKPLVDSFKAMSTQISRLIDEQKQMTNAVSHDLRTPLSRLKFSLAMLEQQDHVSEMKKDVAELEKLIDEILSYGRLESERKTLEVQQVNITELLKNQIEKLKRGTNKKIIFNQKHDVFWPCDGSLLERATQNLITNAISYGETKVKIIAVIKNNYLYISVEDDGDGVAKQEYSNIFKAFVRLDESRNKSKGGFGLGLAIVQRIMQWHQGECTIEQSNLGGAKFELKLFKSNPS